MPRFSSLVAASGHGGLKGESLVYQRAVPHQESLYWPGMPQFSSLVAAPGHGGLKGESPVYQRALPHQGELSLAGHAPILIPQGWPQAMRPYQRSTAKRRAIQHSPRSRDSVGATGMG